MCAITYYLWTHYLTFVTYRRQTCGDSFRSMKILREEDRGCRPGPLTWFSGVVWLDEVVVSQPLKVTRVGFAPGSRTAWHTHPRGQALHILNGTCQVQSRGDAIHEVKSGDSVWIEPGEVHWHG